MLGFSDKKYKCFLLCLHSTCVECMWQHIGAVGLSNWLGAIIVEPSLFIYIQTIFSYFLTRGSIQYFTNYLSTISLCPDFSTCMLCIGTNHNPSTCCSLLILAETFFQTFSSLCFAFYFYTIFEYTFFRYQPTMNPSC